MMLFSQYRRLALLFFLVVSVVVISVLIQGDPDTPELVGPGSKQEREPIPFSSSDEWLDELIAGERVQFEDVSRGRAVVATVETDGPLNPESTRDQIYRLELSAENHDTIAASLISRIEQEEDPSRAFELYAEYLETKQIVETHRAAATLVQAGRYLTYSDDFNAGLFDEGYELLSIGPGRLQETGATVTVAIPVPWEEFPALKDLILSVRSVHRSLDEEYVQEFNSRPFEERQLRYNEIEEAKKKIIDAVREGRHGDHMRLVEQVPPNSVRIERGTYLARLIHDHN